MSLTVSSEVQSAVGHSDLKRASMPDVARHTGRPNRLFDIVNAWIISAAVFAPALDAVSSSVSEQVNRSGQSSVAMPRPARPDAPGDTGYSSDGL